MPPDPNLPRPDEGDSPSQRELDALIGLVSQQRHAEAATLSRQLIARFPRHGFAWKALGASLKAQGQMADAVVAQRRATEFFANDASTHYNLGNSLMALQQPAAAADSYRCAIALKPEHFKAHFNLGNALGALDRLPEAIDSYRHALAIQPDFIDAQAMLGHALQALDRHDEAEACWLQVLAVRSHDASAHNSLGVVYRGQGRMAAAEASYRQALAIHPGYAEAHNNLGNALRDQQRLDEAEASYRQALAINDAMAGAHFNLGNVLRDQERQADAERSYRRALELEPNHITALNNLGLCLKRQGRLEDARECFENAIAIKPDFLQSHCNLAPFKTYRVDDPHLRLFESQQHQLPALPIAGRINYWFALGKMCEDVERYDDAFAAYTEGNRLQHAQFPHDEARDEARAQRLQATFSAAFFAARPQVVRAGRTPIFIVGMPRSGTTLIEQILATYPGIHGAGELVDLPEVVYSIESKSGAAAGGYPERVAALSTEDFRALGEAYLERVWRLAPEAAHIVDKMPANFLHVGMIHLMLPQAKIIHAMRDPMDSCFSCYSRLFVGNNLDFTYNLETVGHYYVRYMELMRHWHRVLPADALLDLRYEDMVADTEDQARRLLDYLGLPWNERCLDFHQNRRVVKTASIAQVRKPIYRSSVARWKHFEKHLSPLLDIVQPYR